MDDFELIERDKKTRDTNVSEYELINAAVRSR